MAMESVNKPTVTGRHHEDKAHPQSQRLPPLLQGLSDQERRDMEKSLVTMLDIRLMPMLVLIYILNYLDRNAIAAARLAGLVEELGLSSVQYQTSVSVLFVGYILMQVPSNLFLSRIGKPALYLSTCMIVWGMLSGATAAVNGFGGLVACRFLLGFVEAAYFPGCMATLSAWYTSKELAFRTAILYCGSLFSGAFSGLISAGITDGMDGVRGLLAWRWIFIIEGVIMVAIASVAYFVLPNFPHNTKRMSKAQRQLAVWRLMKDISADEWESTDKNLTRRFKECIRDSKTWYLVLLVLGAVSSGTINSFFLSVVQSLGKGRIETLLLTSPPYLLSCIVAMAVSRNSDRVQERYFYFSIREKDTGNVVSAPLWISVAGFIISAATTQLASRYFAMMIMLPGVYTAFIIGITWVANTIPTPPAKRAAALALANAVANCSSIYGPYLYPSSAAPRYVLAMGVKAATSVMSIIVASAFRLKLQKLNKKLEMEELATARGNRQDTKGFRYLL